MTSSPVRLKSALGYIPINPFSFVTFELPKNKFMSMVYEAITRLQSKMDVVNYALDAKMSVMGIKEDNLKFQSKIDRIQKFVDEQVSVQPKLSDNVVPLKSYAEGALDTRPMGLPFSKVLKVGLADIPEGVFNYYASRFPTCSEDVIKALSTVFDDIDTGRIIETDLFAMREVVKNSQFLTETVQLSLRDLERLRGDHV